ncbi:ashwin-like [Pararge aegeria]|uniref:Ashwin n=2 Tax=Pararge aegeria TaxID=116150 RepID=A0A8S4S0B5_9NEOP|nr:ashwin-like [Pararge aegeria]CAH2243595.1 jg25806 [Pararge aegeria aegeria]
MAIPCEMLLHPELLTNEQLIQIIQERHLRVQNLHRMARDELLDLFHQFCVPYGQRKYRDSGRGKILNKIRHSNPEPVVLFNTFNDSNVSRKSLRSPCERIKPPPDLLSCHMKRIKLDNKLQNHLSQNFDINVHKRKMSVDLESCEVVSSPPAKKEKKLITWP